MSSSPVSWNAASRAGAEPPTSLRIDLELLGSSASHPSSGAQRAVVADDRRLADLEMDVARAPLDGARQQAVQIHADPIGRTSARAVGESGCIGSASCEVLGDKSCRLGRIADDPPPPDGAKWIGGKIRSLLWPANTAS